MRTTDRSQVPPGGVLLHLENVSLTFGAIQALLDVDVDVYQGEILAIIGPNGAGKTSLLNVINGVYRPQHGRIVFLGQERSPSIRPTHHLMATRSSPCRPAKNRLPAIPSRR